MNSAMKISKLRMPSVIRKGVQYTSVCGDDCKSRVVSECHDADADEAPIVLGIFLSPAASCSRSAGLKKCGATGKSYLDERYDKNKRDNGPSNNHDGLISITCRMYDFDVDTSS